MFYLIIGTLAYMVVLVSEFLFWYVFSCANFYLIYEMFKLEQTRSAKIALRETLYYFRACFLLQMVSTTLLLYL